MTRRERLEAKIEKRREWAGKAVVRGEQHRKVSDQLVEHIPFGQPILVGHHSENAHRRTLERSRNHMFKWVEENALARHHESKAAGLEDQLERCIFSDDDNAIEAIETRMKTNEARRERMKLVNRLYRKGDAEGLAKLGFNYATLKANLEAPGTYSWCRIPHPSYELTNLGARIRADKERIEHIRRLNARRAEVEAAPEGLVIKDHGNGYASVTFAEKPARIILSDLKTAGFHWSSGCWYGRTAAIPASVHKLLNTEDSHGSPTSTQTSSVHDTADPAAGPGFADHELLAEECVA